MAWPRLDDAPSTATTRTGPGRLADRVQCLGGAEPHAEHLDDPFSHSPSTDGWGNFFVMNRDGTDQHVIAKTAMHENHGQWGVAERREAR